MYYYTTYPTDWSYTYIDGAGLARTAPHNLFFNTTRCGKKTMRVKLSLPLVSILVCIFLAQPPAAHCAGRSFTGDGRDFGLPPPHALLCALSNLPIVQEALQVIELFENTPTHTAAALLVNATGYSPIGISEPGRIYHHDRTRTKFISIVSK